MLTLVRVIDTPPTPKSTNPPWINDMDEMCGKWFRVNAHSCTNFKSLSIELHREWYQTLEEVFAGLTEVTINVTPDPFTFSTNHTEKAYRQYFEPRHGKTYKISNDPPTGFCDGIYIDAGGDKVFVPPPWVLMQAAVQPDLELDTDAFLKKQRDEIFRKIFSET
jgi:hypothetical protein